MKIGGFMPIGNGLGRAILEMKAMGGNCVMIYTGSPKSFVRGTIDVAAVERAEELKAELGFGETVIHAPYIMNPANSIIDMQNKAIRCICEEVQRAETYKSSLLVVHPGSSLKEPPEVGIRNLARVLNEVTSIESPVTICIETMAGKGSEIMYSFSHFNQLLSLLEKPERIGVCFDTCHVYDAGYPLSEEGLDDTLADFDKYIGLDKIKVVHVNGSKNWQGSHKDRHANIGIEGTDDNIGASALSALCNRPEFVNIPKILETPWDGDKCHYMEEIRILKG